MKEKKSLQDLVKKVSNMDKKFSKETEIKEQQYSNVEDENLNKSNKKDSRNHHQ
jgi:hypothetical protein